MSALAAVARRELRRLPRLPALWALLGPIPAAMTNTAVTGATFDIDGGQQLVEG